MKSFSYNNIFVLHAMIISLAWFVVIISLKRITPGVLSIRS